MSRKQTEAALIRHVYFLIRTARKIDGHIQNIRDDFIKINHLVARLAQSLMNGSNRFHAPLSFFKLPAHFLIIGSSRLKTQKRRNSLQIIFNPVMNFRNRRVFCFQKLFGIAPLGYVSDNHDSSDPSAVIIQRERYKRKTGIFSIDFRIDHNFPAQRNRKRIGKTGSRLHIICHNIGQIKTVDNALMS